nr:hypothetical protein [Daejeonella rubra]
MKANHNQSAAQETTTLVVVNISSSKNESKSQPLLLPFETDTSCCKYQ